MLPRADTRLKDHVGLDVFPGATRRLSLPQIMFEVVRDESFEHPKGSMARTLDEPSPPTVILGLLLNVHVYLMSSR
jgi:hypothetical protein